MRCLGGLCWDYNNAINGYTCFYDQQNGLEFTYSILNNLFNDYFYSELFSYDKQGNVQSLA